MADRFVTRCIGFTDFVLDDVLFLLDDVVDVVDVVVAEPFLLLLFSSTGGVGIPLSILGDD